MATISYKYELNRKVAILVDGGVAHGFVSQITLEADPTSNQETQNEITYHILELGKDRIHLRPEGLVFVNAKEAVDYLNDPDNFSPTPLVPIDVDYDFELNSIVWSHLECSLISANVTQVTFDVDNGTDSKRTRIFYHILPNVGDDYSSLLRQDFEVFATGEEAIEYIKIISGITPTQTPTPTLTPTPSVTGSVTPTPTITPTVSVTPTVTPTVSVTPTVTPTVSITPSPSVTPTVSVTPSVTPTPTVTPTPSG